MHLRVGASITLKNFVKRNWKVVSITDVVCVCQYILRLGFGALIHSFHWIIYNSCLDLWVISWTIEFKQNS